MASLKAGHGRAPWKGKPNSAEVLEEDPKDAVSLLQLLCGFHQHELVISEREVVPESPKVKQD